MLLAEQGVELEDEVVLRRVVTKDGRSRATGERSAGERGLVAPRGAGCWWRSRASTIRWGWPTRAGHAALLDAYAGHGRLCRATAEAWSAHRAARGGAGGGAGGVGRSGRATRNGCALRWTNWARWPPTRARRSGWRPSASTCMQGERRAEAIAAAGGGGNRAARPAQAGGPPRRCVPPRGALQRIPGAEGGVAAPALGRDRPGGGGAGGGGDAADAAGRGGGGRSAPPGADGGTAVRAACGRPQAWRGGDAAAGAAVPICARGWGRWRLGGAELAAQEAAARAAQEAFAAAAAALSRSRQEAALRLAKAAMRGAAAALSWTAPGSRWR